MTLSLIKKVKEFFILDLFRNLYWEAQKSIKRVEDLTRQITQGIKRPYLRSARRKTDAEDL